MGQVPYSPIPGTQFYHNLPKRPNHPPPPPRKPSYPYQPPSIPQNVPFTKTKLKPFAHHSSHQPGHTKVRNINHFQRWSWVIFTFKRIIENYGGWWWLCYYLQINPNRAGVGWISPHFFKCPFLHEKMVLEVSDIVTFPDTL